MTTAKLINRDSKTEGEAARIERRRAIQSHGREGRSGLRIMLVPGKYKTKVRIYVLPLGI